MNLHVNIKMSADKPTFDMNMVFQQMRDRMVQGNPDEKPFNIKFKRRKYTTDDPEVEELNKSIVQYHVENFKENNPDLYFIKIVAGALKKRFTDLIVIESKEDMGEDSDFDLEIVYRKQDDLQSAWAQTIEQMKLMLGERRCDSIYKSSEQFYLRVILKHESLLVTVAMYCAYLMTGNMKWLIMKYNTEKELINQQETKKKLYLDVMRELHRATGHVRRDLITKWFPGYNFYFC